MAPIVLLLLTASCATAFTCPWSVATSPPGISRITVTRTKRSQRWPPPVGDRGFAAVKARRQSHPEDHEEGESFGDANVVLDDLTWRVEKLRLEERNTKSFLRAGPRFLPYDECRKWVQAWGSRWSTEDDWRQWIAMGEKRNPYIPSRPDEYYGSQWVSWEHFLGVPPSHDKTDGEEEDKNIDDVGGVIVQLESREHPELTPSHHCPDVDLPL